MEDRAAHIFGSAKGGSGGGLFACIGICLLYTSDAADDSLRVDIGGRRIIKKKLQRATPADVAHPTAPRIGRGFCRPVLAAFGTQTVPSYRNTARNFSGKS